MVQCGFLVCPVPEWGQRQWKGGAEENMSEVPTYAEADLGPWAFCTCRNPV